MPFLPPNQQRQSTEGIKALKASQQTHKEKKQTSFNSSFSETT